jgi:hypothetical protein
MSVVDTEIPKSPSVSSLAVSGDSAMDVKEEQPPSADGQQVPLPEEKDAGAADSMKVDEGANTPGQERVEGAPASTTPQSPAAPAAQVSGTSASSSSSSSSSSAGPIRAAPRADPDSFDIAVFYGKPPALAAEALKYVAWEKMAMTAEERYHLPSPTMLDAVIAHIKSGYSTERNRRCSSGGQDLPQEEHLITMMKEAAVDQPEALVKVARLTDAGPVIFFQSLVTRYADVLKSRRFQQDASAYNDSALYSYLRLLEDPSVLNAPPATPEVAQVVPGPLVKNLPDSLSRWREATLIYEEWPGVFCSHLLADEVETLENRGVLCATSFELAYYLDNFLACDDGRNPFTFLISSSESEAEGGKLLDPKWTVAYAAAWERIRASKKIHFRIWPSKSRGRGDSKVVQAYVVNLFTTEAMCEAPQPVAAISSGDSVRIAVTIPTHNWNKAKYDLWEAAGPSQLAEYISKYVKEILASVLGSSAEIEVATIFGREAKARVLMLGRRVFHAYLAVSAEHACDIYVTQVLVNRSLLFRLPPLSEIQAQLESTDQPSKHLMRVLTLAEAERVMWLPKHHMASFFLPVANQLAGLVGAHGVATRNNGDLGILATRECPEIVEVLEAFCGVPTSRRFGYGVELVTGAFPSCAMLAAQLKSALQFDCTVVADRALDVMLVFSPTAAPAAAADGVACQNNSIVKLIPAHHVPAERRWCLQLQGAPTMSPLLITQLEILLRTRRSAPAGTDPKVKEMHSRMMAAFERPASGGNRGKGKGSPSKGKGHEAAGSAASGSGKGGQPSSSKGGSSSSQQGAAKGESTKGSSTTQKGGNAPKGNSKVGTAAESTRVAAASAGGTFSEHVAAPVGQPAVFGPSPAVAARLRSAIPTAARGPATQSPPAPSSSRPPKSPSPAPKRQADGDENEELRLALKFAALQMGISVEDLKSSAKRPKVEK